MPIKRTSREQTARKRAIDIDSGIIPHCEGCRDAKIFPHILEYHHILPVSEATPKDNTNLIFLCPNCHALVHLLRKYSQGGPNFRLSDDLEFWMDERTDATIKDRLWAIATGNTELLTTKHGLVFKDVK